MSKDFDLLVSKGAAIYAKRKAVGNSIPISPIIPDKLGIIVQGDRFSRIIKGGEQVPYPSEKNTYAKSEVFNLPKDSDIITIPICIGNQSRIYQTIRVSKSDLENNLKIGLRLDKDKMLQLKIYS